MDNEHLSSDFSYKKYSLEQLDNWVNDALNCEDITPEDIYDTIIKCVDQSVEYHKKYLTKSIELLSLLKGQRPVNLDNLSENITEANQHDWNDFWTSEDSKKEEEEDLLAYYQICDAIKNGVTY